MQFLYFILLFFALIKIITERTLSADLFEINRGKVEFALIGSDTERLKLFAL